MKLATPSTARCWMAPRIGCIEDSGTDWDTASTYVLQSLLGHDRKSPLLLRVTTADGRVRDGYITNTQEVREDSSDDPDRQAGVVLRLTDDDGNMIEDIRALEWIPYPDLVELAIY